MGRSKRLIFRNKIRIKMLIIAALNRFSHHHLRRADKREKAFWKCWKVRNLRNSHFQKMIIFCHWKQWKVSRKNLKRLLLLINFSIWKLINRLNQKIMPFNLTFSQKMFHNLKRNKSNPKMIFHSSRHLPISPSLLQSHLKAKTKTQQT